VPLEEPAKLRPKSGMSILMSMSRRLQLIMKDKEIERLRACAARDGLTLSEWARRALEKARALEQALKCGHPTGDIEEVLADIERGRGLR
jgi:hypothetical protein